VLRSLTIRGGNDRSWRDTGISPLHPRLQGPAQHPPIGRVGGRRAAPAPLIGCALVLGLLLTGSGCTLPYVLSVGVGELGVLFGSRPISQVLDSNTLDTDTQAKLRYVLDVRQFAVDDLKLAGGNAYTTFYDSDGQPAVYNISACRKDRFEPMTWWFPIVGEIQYLGFFEEAQADAYAEDLVRQGYDVFMYSPHGYSTMGWFADPLFSEALRRDVIDLADLVIHELAHNTVSKNGNSVFNETVATFIGRTGSLMYLSDRLGQDDAALAHATQRWSDTDLYNRFWTELYHALNALYVRDDLTSEQKIAQREDIFTEYQERYTTDYLPGFYDPVRYGGVPNIHIDNALVMIQRRYNFDLDAFQAVYDKLGKDLLAAIEVFKEASAAADPTQYLRDWAAARP
jgi:predicted aminopeptidase